MARLLPDPVVLMADSTGTGLPPTKASVLANLADCGIAHFACHASSHPADPSASLLLLHDHAQDPFTVQSLASIRLDQARLAYLSACETAQNAVPVFLDEAIHLTSAFQLIGFPHVIGTLWAINDAAAVSIAAGFYERLRSADQAAEDPAADTGRSAVALHQVIRQLRDSRPGVPSTWAAYLHSGA